MSELGRAALFFGGYVVLMVALMSVLWFLLEKEKG